MSDEQDTHTDKAVVYESLMPEQKERLRAAIQILIDYLLADGRLTQFCHVSQEMRKGDQTESGSASTRSEADSF